MYMPMVEKNGRIQPPPEKKQNSLWLFLSSYYYFIDCFLTFLSVNKHVNNMLPVVVVGYIHI